MTNDTTTWFTSWFDTPFYHILYKNRDDTEAHAFMDTLTNYLNIPEGGSILDLACGKGRHALYLNKIGYDVTGVDLSENSIAFAKQFENHRLRFDVHDMCTPYHKQFDAVFNLFTSFGYFDDDADNLKTIKAIKAELNAFGFGVIDFMNSEFVIDNLVPEEIKTVNDIEFHLKRYVEDGYIIKMGENFNMVAKTLFGFEDLLEKELTQLGAMYVKKGVRNVAFSGDKGFMYKCNLALRTAVKILKPIHSFNVNSEKDLYDKIYAMDWSQYLKPTGSLAIDATIHSDLFSHSLYIAQKTKDAIVDKFRDTDGQRPNVDLKFPDLKINVHIDRRRCTISLDSSGDSLHKRGYKTATNIAPINEVLAAGLIMLSGWDGQSDFMDPMCGSGTMLVEAAMIACNIPPNLMRKEFAFERWNDWDVDLFEKIEESLLGKTRDFHHKIIGYDKAPSAVAKAQENVKNAQLEDFIEVKHEDFFKTQKGGDEKLHMVFNPPYGERLNIDMEEFYANIGDTLKQNYPGTDAWFITSNLDALKHVGLRPSRKIQLYNAKLESRLVKYVMYEGSKKGKYMK